MMLTNPIILTIAGVEFCSGFLRQAIMQWYRTFAKQTDAALGLTDSPGDFYPMTNDRGAIGIIAEYVWKETVFIGVVVLAALARGVGDYEDLARTLGASRWKRFWHVILPLITPAIVSTSVA